MSTCRDSSQTWRAMSMVNSHGASGAFHRLQLPHHDAMGPLFDGLARHEIGEWRESLLGLEPSHLPRAHPDEAVLAGQLVVSDRTIHDLPSGDRMNRCSVSVAEPAGEGKPGVRL